MPIVALNVPVILPIPLLRADLARAFPDWQWRCGDDDMGKPQDRATLDRSQTIMGRALDGMIMVTIEACEQTLSPEACAPPHRLHLRISQPSTDDAKLARRIAMLVCASMMIGQDDAAHCQFSPDGRWYSTDDMRVGAAICAEDTGEDRRLDDFLTRYGRDCGVAAAEPSPLPELDAGCPQQPRPDPIPHPASFSFPRRSSAGGFGRKGL